MKKTAFILLIALLFSITACSSNSSGTGNGKAYTVSFETNGGSAVDNVETAKLTKDDAPVPTKDGQAFCGWYTDADLKTPISYPFSVKNNTTVYAKWTNSTETIECNDASVQFTDDASYQATYVAVPTTMDLKGLANQGYFIKIVATYDVYYEKDWSLPLYKGAPDHNAYIVDYDEKGTLNEELSTSTTATAETISLVVSAERLSNTNYYLKLSTYNIQNIVHFKNVKITFICQTTE